MSGEGPDLRLEALLSLARSVPLVVRGGWQALAGPASLAESGEDVSTASVGYASLLSVCHASGSVILPTDAGAHGAPRDAPLRVAR